MAELIKQILNTISGPISALIAVVLMLGIVGAIIMVVIGDWRKVAEKGAEMMKALLILAITGALIGFTLQWVDSAIVQIIDALNGTLGTVGTNFSISADLKTTIAGTVALLYAVLLMVTAVTLAVKVGLGESLSSASDGVVKILGAVIVLLLFAGILSKGLEFIKTFSDNQIKGWGNNLK